MSIDFDALRTRLRAAFARGAGHTDGSHADAELERRRQALAARELEADDREVLARVIVVDREGVRLAVPVTSATEVREVEVAVLPGCGRVVNGVFQVRGHCLGLVDPAPLLGPGGPLRHGERTLAAVVSGEPGRVGLRIDEVLDVRILYADEIEPRLADTRHPFVRHITRDGIHVVDVDALMSMPEIRIAGSSAR